MKYIFTLFLLTSCAQKYRTYSVIEKSSFIAGKEQDLIVNKKLKKGRKFTKEYCRGQILFNTNAKKETDRYLEQLVRLSCPKTKYLMDTTVTEVWWTTLVYSRSCVELESYCEL